MSRTRRGGCRPAPMREFDVEDRRSTWLELFFDLCFVAAVAALADGLHHDPTMQGLWHFGALFVPVWWAWMEFTWFATAWDNDDLFHRLAMLVAMLLVIVLAAGISTVLDGKDDIAVRAGLRGAAGAAHRDVRPGVAARRAGTSVRAQLHDRRRDRRGAHAARRCFVDPPLRYWVWAVAVAELMIAPVFAVRAYEGQPFDSRHIPERYGLFTIIVLGEGVVVVTAAPRRTYRSTEGRSPRRCWGSGSPPRSGTRTSRPCRRRRCPAIASRRHSSGGTGTCSRSPASRRPRSGSSWRSRRGRTGTMGSRSRPG